MHDKSYVTINFVPKVLILLNASSHIKRTDKLFLVVFLRACDSHGRQRDERA
jgi:hypothetical protein